MSERREEISFIIGMIHKLCVEYNIVLMPCKTKNGLEYVGIQDNITGQKYVMIKGE